MVAQYIIALVTALAFKGALAGSACHVETGYSCNFGIIGCTARHAVCNHHGFFKNKCECDAGYCADGKTCIVATKAPTATPTAVPTAPPTAQPTAHPTPEPTEAPTAQPTTHPTPEPTEAATPTPTNEITSRPALVQASAVEESSPFGFSAPAFIGGGIIGSLAVLIVSRTFQAEQFGTRAPLLAHE